MVVFALTAAACAGAAAAWMLDRARCRRRNERGCCGGCGVSWTETPSDDKYLIHGRLVCEDCAARARSRLPWELGALTGWILVVTGYAVTALPHSFAMELGFVVAGSTGGVLFATVRRMKSANRRAQERIMAGELPGVRALGDLRCDPPYPLPERTAV